MPLFWGNKSKKQEQTIVKVPDPSIDEILEVHQSALLEVTEKERYSCRVHDFTPEAITLSAPLDEHGFPVRVQPGTRVRIVLQHDKTFFGSDTRVIGSRMENKISLLDVQRPRRVERTDRREFYRVPVDLPIEYRLVGQDEFQYARAADLSGGGIMCLLPRHMSITHGAQLDIRLTIPTSNVSVEARVVVRKVFEPLPRSNNNRVACEFTAILPRTREAIVRYVAQRQLELIRAGRL